MPRFSADTVRRKWPARISYTVLVLAIAFPVVLIFHSVFAGRELREMRSIFLRDRAANIAARLEVMPPEQLRRANFDELLEGDPFVLAIRIFHPADAATGEGPLQAIFSGRVLYHIEDVREGGNAIFRAYIPFHSEAQVHVARIDLSLAAPDFILIHARHSVLMAVLSGAVLLLVTCLAIWSTRRAARLEVQQVETKRLAELGTLSAVLAHEIRNPLGAIKGFAQLARETAEAGRQKPLDAILRETRRLEDLVNSLLLYGRPKQAVIRPTDWDSLAADLDAHIRQAIGARPIRFTSDSQIHRLSTDPDLLKQALLNLVRNSLESIPEGQAGQVSLCAIANRDGALVIAVEDDGPGLPEQVRSKLFTPFVTTKASGTGLGLPVSKKLVETLGGTLRLLPVEPHGTRAEMAFYGTNSGN